MEFALVVPIILFLFLGMAEATFLFSDRHIAQRAADVLADIAAERIAVDPAGWQAGWDTLVDQEAARIDCANHSANVTFPDTTNEPGDRVVVELRCKYEPLVTKGLWPGLVISVRGEAVVRAP